MSSRRGDPRFRAASSRENESESRDYDGVLGFNRKPKSEVDADAIAQVQPSGERMMEKIKPSAGRGSLHRGTSYTQTDRQTDRQGKL